MINSRTALTISLGAACGATIRWAITGLAPWLVLFINILGAFAMGWFSPGPFWGKGFLGGFTSFSAFIALLFDVSFIPATAYLIATACGCIGAWLLGDYWRHRQ